MKNKIYISGKISGLHYLDANRNFMEAKRKVYINVDKKYHNIEGLYFRDIINPLEIKHLFKFWLGYLITDLWYLRKCTHICMMSNWTDSKGACIEHYFGKFIFKLEIIFL